MADDFYDGKFVSKMVNDPLMLRLILEALIVDDLDKKRKTLNLAEVMSEIQDNPEAVIQRANEEADHLLRLLKAIRLTCFASFLALNQTGSEENCQCSMACQQQGLS